MEELGYYREESGYGKCDIILEAIRDLKADMTPYTFSFILSDLQKPLILDIPKNVRIYISGISLSLMKQVPDNYFCYPLIYRFIKFYFQNIVSRENVFLNGLPLSFITSFITLDGMLTSGFSSFRIFNDYENFIVLDSKYDYQMYIKIDNYLFTSNDYYKKLYEDIKDVFEFILNYTTINLHGIIVKEEVEEYIINKFKRFNLETIGTPYQITKTFKGKINDEFEMSFLVPGNNELFIVEDIKTIAYPIISKENYKKLNFFAPIETTLEKEQKGKIHKFISGYLFGLISDIGYENLDISSLINQYILPTSNEIGDSLLDINPFKQFRVPFVFSSKENIRLKSKVKNEYAKNTNPFPAQFEGYDPNYDYDIIVNMYVKFRKVKEISTDFKNLIKEVF